jgi:hypothetical protein
VPARIRTRVFRCFAIAALVVVAVTAPSATASARGPKTPGLKAGDKYVALGSSFASGPMIPDVADQSCLRSTNNYPHLVAAQLKLALTDVSCGGATTDNILSQPQGAHPPQIGAVTPDTKLVTVTIGGNDVNYTVSNLVCANAGAKGQSCVGSGVSPDDLNARLAALPAKMAATLGAIKQAAPNAEVLLVSYFRVLPPSATPCPPSVPMTPKDLQLMVGVGRQLASISKRAATAAKVGFVDIYTPKGHEACATPAQRWVEGQVPASPAFPFHPNAAGMAAAARLIERQAKS